MSFKRYNPCNPCCKLTAGKSTQFLWNVRSKVGKSTSLLWNVAAPTVAGCCGSTSGSQGTLPNDLTVTVPGYGNVTITWSLVLGAGAWRNWSGWGSCTDSNMTFYCTEVSGVQVWNLIFWKDSTGFTVDYYDGLAPAISCDPFYVEFDYPGVASFCSGFETAGTLTITE